MQAPAYWHTLKLAISMAITLICATFGYYAQTSTPPLPDMVWALILLESGYVVLILRRAGIGSPLSYILLCVLPFGSLAAFAMAQMLANGPLKPDGMLLSATFLIGKLLVLACLFRQHRHQQQAVAS